MPRLMCEMEEKTSTKSKMEENAQFEWKEMENRARNHGDDGLSLCHKIGLSYGFEQIIAALLHQLHHTIYMCCGSLNGLCMFVHL